MKKRRIVLASILKPLDDTRMTEKLGATLAKRPGTDVYVIAYPSQAAVNLPNILTHPLRKFKRISLGRLLAPLAVLKKCIEVKPEVLIVNTHELLIVGILNRILFGTVLLYDIQENYARNIRHTTAFPVPVRPMLAAWVRLKEQLLTPWFQGVILAEQCYEQELPFLRGPYLVVENKALLPADFKREPPTDKIRLVFTGTLAESTGVFEAIGLVQKLRPITPQIELVIAGYCAVPATLAKIRSMIATSPFIHLLGGEVLVPHHRILEVIRTANFGIIFYPPSPHTRDRVPTKLYEYLACELPILLQPVPAWLARCTPFKAALAVDFNHPDLPKICAQLNQSFYTTKPQDVTWQSEEARLLTWLDKILV